ncbi:hypothetical protein [Mycobacterium sp.]|uniref:hypothetical protein n=1 Tax=Mycobacterium sp. TaxID=1785 RepID=UPI002B5A94CA|nr:hypothetical protein [Mycobacterium sp.]HME50362.1 hypothetical protein [Mycobacterium sp.]
MPEDPWDAQPTCQGVPLAPNAPAPPPFQYQGQTVNPVFDPGAQEWGFWFQGKWIPLFESGC